MYFKGKWSGTGEKEPLVGVLAASSMWPNGKEKRWHHRKD